MNWKPVFAATLLTGIAFSLFGTYSLWYRPPDVALPSISPANDTMNFAYNPPPSGTERNPLALNAVFYPFPNGTAVSLLKLSPYGNFVTDPSQVSFLFDSSFNATILNRNNGSGIGGAGSWHHYFDKFYGYRPKVTVVQYLFNRTDFSRPDQPTSFVGAEAILSVTGIPVVSEPGRYTITLPYSLPGRGATVLEGFFDLCPAPGYSPTSSTEAFSASSLECPGGFPAYRFRLNQTTQFVITLENPKVEQDYSMNQTWGMFFLGVGVPAIISSIAFLNHASEKSDQQKSEQRESTVGMEPSAELPNFSDFESKQLISDLWDAFPHISGIVALPLIFIGAIETLVYGARGIPLLVVGLVYLVLPFYFRRRPKKRTLYQTLIAGAGAVFVGALAYYVAVAPSFGSLESAGYFALIGLSLALFLAGVGDISVQMGRLAIESRIDALKKELEEFRQDDEERWGDANE